jgi:hypothetical protein
MRVGPRLLAAVGVAPVAIHLTLAWLLTGPLSWSVAGAGLARLAAALAAVAAAFAVARAEFGGLGGLVPRPNRALLRAMLTEGSVLGLQQAVAGLMVLLLYLAAGRAGNTTLAALTLTHSGVYPLLFCFAWGGSQAAGAAAAQAVGRGDAGELARVTRLCLGLSAVLAFTLPWGAFAACGGPTFAWLVGDGPAGGAVLAASGRFMGWLAVFFVFDFAINFLSALLRAAQEQAYLLKATAAAAVGFGLLLLALPPRPDGACLLGTFIIAQAAWAVFLLLRVTSRWPGRAVKSAWPLPGVQEVESGAPADRLPNRVEGPGRDDPRGIGAGGRRPIPGLTVMPKISTTEEPAMDPLHPNTALLPPALRALALGLLVETVMPLLNRSREESPGPLARGARGADGQSELWQTLRYKCGELSALVLRAADPGEAAAYVLGYLPKHFDFVFELLGKRYRPKEEGRSGASSPPGARPLQGRSVPDLDRPVVAGRGQAVPVPAEDDGAEPLGVPPQRQ